MEGGQAAYLQIPVMPNCFSEEVFNRWPELYAKQQGIVLESGTGQALVNLALGRGVDQFVIWDPNLPATINVATTLAWLRGTAAFSPDDAVGPLAENLHLALDLRTLGLHNSANAYRWVLGQIEDESPSTLALVSVGDLPGDPTEGIVRWTVRDYAVGARGFAWSADLHHMTFGGEPAAGLEATILGIVGAKRATMFGWSNDETAQTVLSSRNGWIRRRRYAGAPRRKPDSS